MTTTTTPPGLPGVLDDLPAWELAYKEAVAWARLLKRWCGKVCAAAEVHQFVRDLAGEYLKDARQGRREARTPADLLAG